MLTYADGYGVAGKEMQEVLQKLLAYAALSYKLLLCVLRVQ